MPTVFQNSDNILEFWTNDKKSCGQENRATSLVSKTFFNDHSPRPALPEGSMLLSDFLDKIEAEPEIAPLLPAARRNLALHYEDVQAAPTLRTLRLRKGLSQKELATSLGTSQAAVSEYEARTRKLTEDTIRKMAQVLEVDFNTLMDALKYG